MNVKETCKDMVRDCSIIWIINYLLQNVELFVDYPTDNNYISWVNGIKECTTVRRSLQVCSPINTIFSYSNTVKTVVTVTFV